MKIGLTTIYVDDQDKALGFYTGVVGFQKKADVSNGPYRWLTVVSPEDPDGAQLHLEANVDPAARAFQQARYEQSQPAALLYTNDVRGDHARLEQRGARFTMPPTNVPGSTIAIFDDTCGNLIQIVQLKGGR